MGNTCKGSSSSMVWAGDDWSDSPSLEEDQVEMKKHTARRETRASVGKKGDFSSSSSGSGNRTVKIKMTKKELEKLLEEVDMKGVSLEQVMARFAGCADTYSSESKRSWRPALHSIPEVN